MATPAFSNESARIRTLDSDFIVTPEKAIATKTRISRPLGIYWEYLDEEKIAAIPLLKKMQKKVRAGRPV